MNVRSRVSGFSPIIVSDSWLQGSHRAWMSQMWNTDLSRGRLQTHDLPHLHCIPEIEDTGLKICCGVERSDATGWKGRQAGEGLGLPGSDVSMSGWSHAYWWRRDSSSWGLSQDVRTIWRQLQSSCLYFHDWRCILQPAKCAEHSRLCLTDKGTVRNQVHTGKRQRCVSSGKEGVDIERSVLAVWLGKSGSGEILKDVQQTAGWLW